ncbi:MAG: hypothetical protein ABEK59_04755 [Halobacteria archaeon]
MVFNGADLSVPDDVDITEPDGRTAIFRNEDAGKVGSINRVNPDFDGGYTCYRIENQGNEIIEFYRKPGETGMKLETVTQTLTGALSKESLSLDGKISQHRPVSAPECLGCGHRFSVHQLCDPETAIESGDGLICSICHEEKPVDNYISGSLGKNEA